MSAESISRRSFLGQAAGGVAALGTSPLIARGAPGANERISIGVIGTGDRGRGWHIHQIIALAKSHNAAVTAVCDVWQPNLKKGAAQARQAFGQEPREFTRFGDLLALPDVDAVMIATPDFAHTPIMVEALKAGKDVYVEKPMSLTVAEANEALDLARSNKRVVQVGTQRRSEGVFKAAKEEIASGVLGTISRVDVGVYVNHPRWARPYDDCKESDVDWDAYLFNRPKVPFDPKLLRRWHLYRMCTNGLSGLWMAHYSDGVNMMLGTTYPRSAVAHGGLYVWKDGREHGDTFQALLDFPEGFLMNWGMGLANATGNHWTINGTKATLDAEKWTITNDIPTGTGGKAESRKIKPEPSDNHVGNWLDCIRSRKCPNADIQDGHQHAIATIMAAAAYETGRRQVYDPKTREIKAG
jgi:predicted dehydrogenase